MLDNGVWRAKWQPIQHKDSQGRFIRERAVFRHWLTPDGAAGPSGQAGFKAEAGRYHLYVAYICPWASRTLIARALKGLESVIGVTVVNPRLSEQGWQFGGFSGSHNDELYGHRYVHQLYTQAEPNYTGRATVPVLWDKHRKTIVSNESADILRMLNSAFAGLHEQGPDYYPPAARDAIDQMNDYLYHNLNNAVYQAGFASSQAAYEEAYARVFATLDQLETQLSDGRRFLLGEAISESDIRLFVTLVRFDVAYYSLFKCNRQRIADMPHLHRYMHAMLAMPEVKRSVQLEHIKAGYYSIKALNPSGIVPLGPDHI